MQTALFHLSNEAHPTLLLRDSNSSCIRNDNLIIFLGVVFPPCQTPTLSIAIIGSNKSPPCKPLSPVLLLGEFKPTL